MKSDRAPLKILCFRICVGIGLGLLAGLLMMLAQHLTEGIHPLDRWHAFAVFEIIGTIAGAIVGVAWGIAAICDDRSSCNSPASNPDAPPESK